MTPRIGPTLASLTLKPIQAHRSPSRAPACLRRAAEEVAEGLGRHLGCAFRKEMTSRQGSALNVVGPTTPERKRSTLRPIPGVERAPCTPQHQNRAANATAACAIRLIMGAVDRCGGTVVFANGVRV